MRSPSYEEALYMVRVKRGRAKAALTEIIKDYSAISTQPCPGLEVLLDYFNNMVYGLELLLKVLSKDWDTPDGTSRCKHNVGKMYELVFSRHYAVSPDLMQHLANAIRDQKFHCDPDNNLLDRVPELEALWDELTQEFVNRYSNTIRQTEKQVEMPENFLEYLGNNVERFVKGEPRHGLYSKAERIQRLKAEIDFRQRQIQQLEASTESDEEERARYEREMFEEFRQQLDSCRNMIRMRLTEEWMGGGRLTFGVWMMRYTGPGFTGLED